MRDGVVAFTGALRGRPTIPDDRSPKQGLTATETSLELRRKDLSCLESPHSDASGIWTIFYPKPSTLVPIHGA